MNANHPYGQMLAQTHFMQMPHVSAWLTHAVGNPGSTSGTVAVPQSHLPVAGYKTSPPLTPMTTNLRDHRGAFRGSGAAV